MVLNSSLALFCFGIPRLEKYTFPSEARFFDTDFAKHAYEKSVRRHLKNGTTLCAYFATIHLEATKVRIIPLC